MSYSFILHLKQFLPWLRLLKSIEIDCLTFENLYDTIEELYK